jgi:hypothetical protein
VHKIFASREGTYSACSRECRRQLMLAARDKKKPLDPALWKLALSTTWKL